MGNAPSAEQTTLPLYSRNTKQQETTPLFSQPIPTPTTRLT